MSRFSVLIGLLCVSVIVLVVNWPLVQPELSLLVGILYPHVISWIEMLRAAFATL